MLGHNLCDLRLALLVNVAVGHGEHFVPSEEIVCCSATSILHPRSHLLATLSHVATVHASNSLLQGAHVGRTSISKVAVLLIEHFGVAIEHLVNGKLHPHGQRLFTPCSIRVEFVLDFNSFIVDH